MGSYFGFIFQNVGHFDLNRSSGDVPQLKGARCFTYEELKKYTNNFSEANNIGSGGYGKVMFDSFSLASSPCLDGCIWKNSVCVAGSFVPGIPSSNF